MKISVFTILRWGIALFLIGFFGFFGILFYFGDYGTGENIYTRIILSGWYTYVLGSIVGFLLFPYWKLAGLVAWGLVAFSLLTLTRSLSLGISEILPSFLAGVFPLVLGLIGGKTGAMLKEGMMSKGKSLLTAKVSFLMIFLFLALSVIGYMVVSREVQKRSPSLIARSFEECVAQGNPILETYPPQCRTADGSTIFIQEVGNEVEYIDEIRVESPRPNTRITSPLIIEGKARGMWFFEASFSAEVYDDNGKNLGAGVLTAKGEWMTKEFVPFEGNVSFTPSTTKKGKIIVKNANPSGLPENQKELIIPIIFTTN